MQSKGKLLATTVRFRLHGDLPSLVKQPNKPFLSGLRENKNHVNSCTRPCILCGYQSSCHETKYSCCVSRRVCSSSKLESEDYATDVVIAAPAESFLRKFLCCCLSVLDILDEGDGILVANNIPKPI